MASRFDDEHAPIFSVGQVADLLGVQSAFVRRLDTEQVVQPARSAGGQRRYSQVQVDRVAQVSSMASEGLNLAGIRRILALEAEVERLECQVRRLEAQAQTERRSGGHG
ncbi:MerR family transcriptional regulator [Aquihabitans daechungensis]|uniref:MerR family transcriptional regulator n=1 Tax=Aquihabitans daechungensis TaxID=1052257 RepID=UPI003BA20DAA